MTNQNRKTPTKNDLVSCGVLGDGGTGRSSRVKGPGRNANGSKPNSSNGQGIKNLIILERLEMGMGWYGVLRERGRQLRASHQGVDVDVVVDRAAWARIDITKRVQLLVSESLAASDKMQYWD
jgi:hypothetical protein